MTQLGRAAGAEPQAKRGLESAAEMCPVCRNTDITELNYSKSPATVPARWLANIFFSGRLGFTIVLHHEVEVGGNSSNCTLILFFLLTLYLDIMQFYLYSVFPVENLLAFLHRPKTYLGELGTLSHPNFECEWFGICFPVTPL